MDPTIDATVAQQMLHRSYVERGIFLVLGAGVSLKSGLPSWPDLLDRLFSTCYSSPRPDLFLNLKDEGMPLPVIASLLEENARSYGDTHAPREAFTDLVREALYRDFVWFPGGVRRDRAREFADMIDAQNRTLRAVSALCVSHSSNSGLFSPNPRVKGVVTFNLDSLLQAHSWAKYCVNPKRQRILRTVERPSARSRSDKISVYHVHGHMRFDRKLGDPTKEAPDQMVLTEQDYFDAFNDYTRMFNYTFLHLLREHTAIFIGLSMQDENLRRLLHYSRMERVRALRAERVDRAEIGPRVRRHVAVLRKFPDPALNDAYELTLAPLGVIVVWLDSFEEIPSYLERVYSSTGDNWSDVYGHETRVTTS